MANVLPLCALRYSPARLQPSVLAPPYDVISPDERARLAAGDPHNIVQIDLGPKPEEPAWYEQASATLRRWRDEGVLERDDEPAFYGYEQRFRLGQGPELVRRGFIGRVELRPWGDGIYRHERTRLGPRADRLALMRATGMQTSPVFGMYEDPDGELAALLRPSAAPLLDYTDPDGVRQIVWRIADPAAVLAISNYLAPRPLVIADGHHRYETALAYQAERRAADGDPATLQPYDLTLMYLTAVEDPGLVVLATHRVVSDCPLDVPHMRAELSQAFDITTLPAEADLAVAAAEARGGSSDVVLGACLPTGERWLLRLRDEQAARAAAQGVVEPELALLDVVVLQNLILAPHLGLSPEEVARTECVHYTIHADEACQAVEQGRAVAAFVLNPTPLSLVWQAALRGVTMPQKSTYFFPKVLTGLVINPLDVA